MFNLMSNHYKLSLQEAIQVLLLNEKNRKSHLVIIFSIIHARKLYTPSENSKLFCEELAAFYKELANEESLLYNNIGTGFIELKDTYSEYLLMLMEELNAILEYNQRLFQPVPKHVKVYDIKMDSRREVEFHSNNIVCIITKKVEDAAPKAKKTSGDTKYIYYKEVNLKKEEEIGVYTVDDSLNSLLEKFDPQHRYLAKVSDKAIVNIAFFSLEKNNKLSTHLSFTELRKLPEISFSESSAGRHNKSSFKLIQRAYKDRISTEFSIRSLLESHQHN